MIETRDAMDAGGMMEGCSLTITNKSYDSSFSIFRPVYTQYEFDVDHEANYRTLSWNDKVHQTVSKLKNKYLTPQVFTKFWSGKFPFIQIMMRYKWKQWLLADIIAGLIVGVMHIPQGMAYAQLTGLKPVYGLYVSFFPTIVYFFLGTSRHISIGPIAILSLMTGKFYEKSSSDFPIKTDYNHTLHGNISVAKFNELIMVGRVAGFGLAVGITQFTMGVLNLGLFTRYLSDPIISGFTVGSSMHVFTSQIKNCFGVKIPKYRGVFNIIHTIIAVLKKLPQTNIPTIVMTFISMALLFITKEIVNPHVVKKIKVPIPMELFMVIAGTVASRYLHLHAEYNVNVVGEIARGIPAPIIPQLQNTSNYLTDIIITAVIGFSICVSLGRIFGKKHGYKINPNQEFLAYGIMNIFSSFFSCYPAASSLSRSAVQESVGGKTQLTSLISSSLLVLVLLFIGPLFEDLPTCILSSIIIVALKGIFMQLGELKEYWIFSLWDFNIWIATFLGTVILDVEYGLMTGVGLSILSIMLRTQSPQAHIMGQVQGTDLYKNVEIYKDSKEIPGIKIFRYEGSLYYACCDHFRKSLYLKVQCDPRHITSKILKLDRKLKKVIRNLDRSPGDALLMDKQKMLQREIYNTKNTHIHDIIIDCSTWSYIDIVGVKTLNQVIEEYKFINITVTLANPKTDIRKMFYRIKCQEYIDDKIIYVSVHDAVVCSLYRFKAAMVAEECSFN